MRLILSKVHIYSLACSCLLERASELRNATQSEPNELEYDTIIALFDKALFEYLVNSREANLQRSFQQFNHELLGKINYLQENESATPLLEVLLQEMSETLEEWWPEPRKTDQVKC